MLYVEPFMPNSLQRIFCNVMEWFFMNQGKDMVKVKVVVKQGHTQNLKLK